MNCIVIDDEPLAREKIRLLVAQDVSLQLLGCFPAADKAADFMELNPVDLIFLDVQMPGGSGLDFARQLPPEVMVIFTSAYAEYALNSYDVNAIDYLVKPVHPARFAQAVQKAMDFADMKRHRKQQQQQTAALHKDHVFVRADRRLHRVVFSDCRYIEGIKDYSILHLSDRKLMVGVNLKALLEQLPQDIFVRISKSVVVNFRHVSSLNHQDVRIGEAELLIGNAYREYLFSFFVEHHVVGR
ncbi:response regulator transcription factor [Chitinophaga oryzae]|uniref:Response regulator transcription factor n=1 Tax=Chitinophaga oryzae TaxID=2725414 RepID=A0AAE6ZHE7_9BACT|nr:LytTR family DNA-binding domain-containing protein [Chitinophaga oryzae]QJB33010.1 response regulator transcription factor [Chitinophaga oryzae]QJB39484.1 response regulator transcription factor [Chitinophaga oryzae]